MWIYETLEAARAANENMGEMLEFMKFSGVLENVNIEITSSRKALPTLSTDNGAADPSPLHRCSAGRDDDRDSMRPASDRDRGRHSISGFRPVTTAQIGAESSLRDTRVFECSVPASSAATASSRLGRPQDDVRAEKLSTPSDVAEALSAQNFGNILW